MLASKEPLLEIRDLNLEFQVQGKRIKCVRNLNLTIPNGGIVALVGESGCGKSLTARAILGLPPENASVSGEIFFKGQDLFQLSNGSFAKMRGRHLAMIFQEPMTALNPVLTCGEQVAEVLQTHTQCSFEEAKEKTCALFTQVGIPDAVRRFASYPHQLSGGLRQRVLIAMALCCDPELLLADEPTTALDSTMCQQILELLLSQSKQRGMAVLLISHDLENVRAYADMVCVMYAGSIVEQAPTHEFFLNPKHPYTEGLLLASPRRIQSSVRRLPMIKGTVPSFANMPKGCPFAPRCSCALAVCHEELPELKNVDGHFVSCHKYD